MIEVHVDGVPGWLVDIRLPDNTWHQAAVAAWITWVLTVKHTVSLQNAAWHRTAWAAGGTLQGTGAALHCLAAEIEGCLVLAGQGTDRRFALSPDLPDWTYTNSEPGRVRFAAPYPVPLEATRTAYLHTTHLGEPPAWGPELPPAADPASVPVRTLQWYEAQLLKPQALPQTLLGRIGGTYWDRYWTRRGLPPGWEPATWDRYRIQARQILNATVRLALTYNLVPAMQPTWCLGVRWLPYGRISYRPGPDLLALLVQRATAGAATAMPLLPAHPTSGPRVQRLLSLPLTH